MVIRAKKNSGDIVFPARCEDVDYEGILQRGSAVLHAATHRERVSCAQFETFPPAVHCPMPAPNVHNLIVWMAVHRSRPPLQHSVLREKKLVVKRQHAPCESGFRTGFFAVVMRRHHKVGIGLALRFHLVPPIQRVSAVRSTLTGAEFRASLTSCT